MTTSGLGQNRKWPHLNGMSALPLKSDYSIVGHYATDRGKLPALCLPTDKLFTETLSVVD